MITGSQQVKTSFQQIVRHHQRQFVTKFYNNLSAADDRVPALFENVDVAVQRHKLWGAIVMIIKAVDDPEHLRSLMLEVGIQHAVAYNVPMDVMALFGDVMLVTLAETLGTSWTPELEDAWRETLSFVTIGTLEAYIIMQEHQTE
jgi:hemoglobin-like flavoprotein